MHAPISLWPAPDEDWRLPSTLIGEIHSRSILPLPAKASKLQRHNILQARMLELGLELGFAIQAEAPTGHRKMVRTGRFDLVWTPPGPAPRRIVFEIDSCWRQESLLKLGRLADSDLRLWVYYGQRPFPIEPTEPGFRKLNILRISAADLGIRSSARRSMLLAPGEWPAMLYPRRAEHGR